MTEEQIKMLRGLIEDQVECALIDGMEHGAWGWAEQQLDKRWKEFQESFNVDISTVGSDLLDAFHDRAINSKNKND